MSIVNDFQDIAARMNRKAPEPEQPAPTPSLAEQAAIKALKAMGYVYIENVNMWAYDMKPRKLINVSITAHKIST